MITNIFRNRNKQAILKDVVAGIIVALVSIPISMGYSQIAGLPPVYGLYGSILPIFIYSLITSSPQFVVGVDAMPAVMVGGLLASLGIAAGTPDALAMSPLISVLVSIWFVLFYFLKAGRITKYISTPVMGGFISGVGVTIIMMQIPKLYGGNAGTGELFVLLGNIISELSNFNTFSAILGIGTVVIIMVFKKRAPKIPMAVIMMVIGVLLQALFHLDRYGVKMLPAVSSGLPEIVVPDFSLFSYGSTEIIIESLSIAAVIMAQTLLATGSLASKYGDNIDNSRELLAYAAMNAAGSIVGCCPVNGSVSRSGIADSYGCRSQLMSLTAAAVMVLVILLGTPFLCYMPVPILTGIVMTALIGIIDFKLASRLYLTQKNEFVIFMLSFSAVLIFGTVNGVLIGCALSFADVAFQAVQPSTGFIGRIPGQGNYYELNRNSTAKPIKNTVIYRFNGNLFFANVDKFKSDIFSAIKPDTKRIIIDARCIDDIDVTAADQIMNIYKTLKSRGINFYLTEHSGFLNDSIRKLGADELIENGCVRRTISLALESEGLYKPYDLEESESVDIIPDDIQQFAEFEWAFGEKAEERLEALAGAITENILSVPDEKDIDQSIEQQLIIPNTGHIGLFDEDELLNRIELRLESIAAKGIITKEELSILEEHLEKRRENDRVSLEESNPKAIEILAKHKEKLESHFKQEHPAEYEHLKALRDAMNRH